MGSKQEVKHGATAERKEKGSCSTYSRKEYTENRREANIGEKHNRRGLNEIL